jgi:hypothetical protein
MKQYGERVVNGARENLKALSFTYLMIENQLITKEGHRSPLDKDSFLHCSEYYGELKVPYLQKMNK